MAEKPYRPGQIWPSRKPRLREHIAECRRALHDPAWVSPIQVRLFTTAEELGQAAHGDDILDGASEIA